ncbi:hypothetical protein BDQ94DRAFT_155338 [Aspergillus welwitschiae]|uniref:Uncharacterized protein n=1 Tax=Aspergillus welwitschiae TaxID=1341132 RepID=A0A3F3PI05_9EURO|nr:hypothetical protein BDQ94DRAFT_155338 [Aspergillus welwitschiae]RDH26570.1 hypothetical protein BDQ94DRAFT_155338 [Aspergillus welwitschiae]
MHHRASEIARLVTAWGGDLATMRQPATPGPTHDLGIREPDVSETGKSSDKTTWGCVCARLKTQNSPLVFVGARLWLEVNL